MTHRRTCKKTVNIFIANGEAAYISKLHTFLWTFKTTEYVWQFDQRLSKVHRANDEACGSHPPKWLAQSDRHLGRGDKLAASCFNTPATVRLFALRLCNQFDNYISQHCFEVYREHCSIFVDTVYVRYYFSSSHLILVRSPGLSLLKKSIHSMSDVHLHSKKCFGIAELSAAWRPATC